MAGIEQDPIEEAVGFKMNNLLAFAFFRLPNTLQRDVLEEVEPDSMIELFKVNSGLQEYITRNGPFGRRVDSITFGIASTRHQVYIDRSVLIIRKHRHPTIYIGDFITRKALFSNIRSCRKFSMIPVHKMIEKKKIKESIARKLEYQYVHKIAQCLPNLRFVDEFRSRTEWVAVHQRIREAFKFKVLKFAYLKFYLEDLTRIQKCIKGFLEDQLEICERVMLIDLDQADDVLPKIPGMLLEDDLKKCDEILDSFKSKRAIDMDDCFGVACYRRKIDNHKGLYVVVWKDMFAKDSDCDSDYDCL